MLASVARADLTKFSPAALNCKETFGESLIACTKKIQPEFCSESIFGNSQGTICLFETALVKTRQLLRLVACLAAVVLRYFL